jgi:hypothetical protein
LALAKLLLVNKENKKIKQKRGKRKRFWTRPWLLKRPTMGQYAGLLEELMQEDVSSFKNFLRVDPAMFQELLARVGPRLENQDTFWRKALDSGLKCAITLRSFG